MIEFNQYDSLFQKYAGSDWLILKRIAFLESTLGQHPRVKRGLENPNDVEGSVSEDGLSWGLLQFLPSTARSYDTTVTPQKLNNAEYSIRIGALHLAAIKKYLLKNSNVQPSRLDEYAIRAWNQGMGSVRNEINYGLTDKESDAYWKRYVEEALTEIA